MNIRPFFFACLSFCFFLSAEEGKQPEKTDVQTKIDALITTVHSEELEHFHHLIEGNNRFAFDFYQKIKHKGGNFCFSPLGIISGLSLAASGAKGETANQFFQLFHYSLNILPLLRNLKDLIETPSQHMGNQAQVYMPNAIWLGKDLTVSNSFKIGLQRHYDFNLQTVDFKNDSSSSIRSINQWFSEQTEGKINNLVTGSGITQKTQFLITSAFAMKGAWEHPFNTRMTKRQSFQLEGKRTASVEMMHTSMETLFLESEKCDLAALPYQNEEGGGQLLLVILIPKKITLTEFEKELTWDSWQQWISQLQARRIEISLPRFRIEKDWDITSSLQAMGLRLPFTPQADFSVISNDKNLFVNQAIHKSALKVAEMGSDLAAFPFPPVIKENSALQPASFIADHPFLFILLEKRSGSLLLMGRINLPSS